MFGRFALRSLRLVFFLCLASPVGAAGPVKRGPVSEVKAGAWQQAQVITPEANVYQAADFDSPVLGHLKAGTVWNISKEVTGAFYQIRVRDNLIGYVCDVDVKAGKPIVKGRVSPEKSKPLSGSTPEKKEPASKKERPFEYTDFWGIELASIRFRENTMGLRPTDQLSFYGLQFSGPNIVFDGYTTEFNALVSLGAPRYYQQATGNDTSGFIFLTDFLFIQNRNLSRDVMFFFGFGPMFKFSKFEVALNCDAGLCNGTTTGTLPESLTDMSLGAVFDTGITQRLSTSFALRAELQYYWEKLQYYGFSLSGQFSF